MKTKPNRAAELEALIAEDNRLLEENQREYWRIIKQSQTHLAEQRRIYLKSRPRIMVKQG